MSIVSSLPEESTTDEVSRSRCSTHINVTTKLSHIWVINDFSLYDGEIGEQLKSSTFPVGENNKFKWCLLLYPRGKNERYKNYLSLFLKLCSGTEVRTIVKISILNQNQEKKNEYRFLYRFVKKGGEWGKEEYIPRFFLLNKANKLLTDDKLILECEINAISDPVNVREENVPRPIKVPECSLLNDIENLFENLRFSDIILSVKGREFAVHKTILALRSPVFAAMFEHEMQEKNLNRVEIEDVDAKVMKEIIRFIYTGKVRSLKKMASDLLAAADKYALERLKAMCEDALCANLSVVTASNTLVLADLHNAEQLKSRAVDFISLHATEVMATSDWKKMAIHHPHLFQQTLVPGLPKRKSKLTFRLRNFTNFWR